MIAEGRQFEKGSRMYLETDSENCIYRVVSLGLFNTTSCYRVERSGADSILLVAMESGRMNIRTEGGCAVLEKGCCALFDCSAGHSYDTPVPSSFLWMHFKGPDVSKLTRSITDGGAGMVLADVWEDAKNLCHAILATHEGNAAIKKERQSSMLYSFLMKALERNAPRHSTDRDIRVRKAEEYIMLTLADRPKLEEIARQASISKSQLERLFVKEEGMSVHAYILERRFDTAKRLLAESDLPVARIAFQTGFSESSFSGKFRKRTGLTPLEYRRRGKVFE